MPPPGNSDLSAASEEEQFAFLKSRNSTSEKLNALRQVGLQNPRSAYRLLGTATRSWFGDEARDLSRFAWVDEGER
jgi:hypothetical protein